MQSVPVTPPPPLPPLPPVPSREHQRDHFNTDTQTVSLKDREGQTHIEYTFKRQRDGGTERGGQVPPPPRPPDALTTGPRVLDGDEEPAQALRPAPGAVVGVGAAVLAAHGLVGAVALDGVAGAAGALLLHHAHAVEGARRLTALWRTNGERRSEWVSRLRGQLSVEPNRPSAGFAFPHCCSAGLCSNAAAVRLNTCLFAAALR